MTIRSDLLTQLGTNLAAHTGFKVSDELPFDSAGTPLYEKNMKTVYVSEAAKDIVEHVPLLTGEIMQTETSVTAYLTTDAKNQPSDIDTVTANVLSARTAVSNTFDSSSSVEIDIEDDKITYTFEYNFIIV